MVVVQEASLERRLEQARLMVQSLESTGGQLRSALEESKTTAEVRRLPCLLF